MLISVRRTGGLALLQASEIATVRRAKAIRRREWHNPATVVAATPASIERSFAAHAAAVARASTAPEVCYPAGCTTTFAWGKDRPIYFKPVKGKDFVVVLFNQQTDAVRTANFNTKSGLGVARHGSVVLLYYKLSTRLTRLRAALAATT